MVMSLCPEPSSFIFAKRGIQQSITVPSIQEDLKSLVDKQPRAFLSSQLP